MGVALLVLAVALPGCFPGNCDGAFRWLSAAGEPSETERSRTMPIPPGATFALSSDSAEATPAELLERSKVSPATFFLIGPRGRVAAQIEARYFQSAHSCANAASFTLTPAAPLAPGDYTVVLLIDKASWPAVFDDDVTTYEGGRALVRRYRVEQR